MSGTSSTITPIYFSYPRTHDQIGLGPDQTSAHSTIMTQGHAVQESRCQNANASLATAPAGCWQATRWRVRAGRRDGAWKRRHRECCLPEGVGGLRLVVELLGHIYDLQRYHVPYLLMGTWRGSRISPGRRFPSSISTPLLSRRQAPAPLESA